MPNTNRDALEALRAFAVACGELQFAHLCTAALAGEEWAMARLEATLRVWAVARTMPPVTIMVDVIRSTDTTRPDGSVGAASVPDSSFNVYIHLRCPECGEVRDNPHAKTKNEEGRFRNLVNAAAPKYCARCIRNFATLGVYPNSRPIR